MVSLEIRQVNFAYFDGFVLRNIDFFIKAGEMVGLLGVNQFIVFIPQSFIC